MWDRGIRWLVPLVLAVAVVGGSAARAAHPYPMPSPPAEMVRAFRALPAERRDNVHIYFLNGLDPLNRDNFRGLCDQVKDLGFGNVSFGQMVHKEPFRRAIVATYRRNPTARFVVVGFSFGANLAASLTNALREDGIFVDLLVYLGGDTIANKPEHRPLNACRIVNVTAHGCVWLFGGYVWKGEDIAGAENHRLPDCGHAQVPTHVLTQKRVLDALLDVASKAD